MYGWNEKPTKAEVKYRVGDPVTECVYSIGAYEVTVPGDEQPVTYRHKYRESTDPRRTLPNMEIADGEIRIPVTDLVGEVLTRLEPRDLAVALWDNQEVRDEFIHCLTARWSQDGVDDADRRKVLAEIKGAIHSKAVDTLASHMAKIEYELSQKHHFWNQIRALEDWLDNLGVKDRDGKPFRFGRDDTPELKIGGMRWDEARDFWRNEVRQQFQGPEIPSTAEPDL